MYMHMYMYMKAEEIPISESLSLLQVILVESRHTGQKYIFKVLYKSLQAMAAVGRGRSKATTNRTPVSKL